MLITNTANPYDVNSDSSVTPLDVLLVVNALNGAGAVTLGASEPQHYLDVNGDQYLTALDALLVINVLNAGPGIAALLTAAEGEAAAAPWWPGWPGPALPHKVATWSVAGPTTTVTSPGPCVMQTPVPPPSDASRFERNRKTNGLYDQSVIDFDLQDEGTLDTLLLEPLLSILAEDAILGMKMMNGIGRGGHG